MAVPKNTNEDLDSRPDGASIRAIGVLVVKLASPHDGETSIDLAAIKSLRAPADELVWRVVKLREKQPSLSPTRAWDVVRHEYYGVPLEF
jgi:hypothetical protein